MGGTWKELGRQYGTDHRKDNKNNENNKVNKNDSRVKRHAQDSGQVVQETLEAPEGVWEGQAGPGRAGKMNFCPEMHQQGFMSVTGHNTQVPSHLTN